MRIRSKLVEEKTIVKDFIFMGRRCIVIKIDKTEQVKGLPAGIRDAFKPYHNGYVEVKKNEIKKDYGKYNIRSDEITYQGDLELKDGKIYIGFDSVHFWNEGNPESKKIDHVTRTCKKIVWELNNVRT